MDLDSIMQKTFSSLVTSAHMERDAVFQAFLSAQDCMAWDAMSDARTGPAGAACEAERGREAIWTAILLQRNYLSVRGKRVAFLRARLHAVARHPAVQRLKISEKWQVREDEGRGGAVYGADEEMDGSSVNRRGAADAQATLEAHVHLTWTSVSGCEPKACSVTGEAPHREQEAGPGLFTKFPAPAPGTQEFGNDRDRVWDKAPVSAGPGVVECAGGGGGGAGGRGAASEEAPATCAAARAQAQVE